ncbi:MAG: PQQ-dependent sugar dehydrogenase [Dehalococcoidia bacterium]
MARLLLVLCGCVALIAACAGGDGGDEASPTAEGTPASTAPVVEVTATTTATPIDGATPRPSPTFPPVAAPQAVGLLPAYESLALDHPVEILSYPLGGFEVVIADQGGVIVGVREGETTELLSITGRVLAPGNEEGLLSVALDPQFTTNRHVWLYYSASDPRRTVLSRFTANEDGTIAPGTELLVLEQGQPFPNHNGGSVRFGPDRMLYLGLGDGGSGGDPEGNGQNLGTLLGKIIRIDVSAASDDEPYRVPSDNPFLGEDGARSEIWAYGLRNPWRMSFDAATGELWVGDVGQGSLEEVGVARAGDNLGWDIMEGDACFEASSCDQSGLTAPLAVYDHSAGRCSVTGGVVARRATATNIEGAYVYGDFCSGDLWALPSTAIDDGGEPVMIASGAGQISSIAQVGGQIYILTFGQPVQRLVDQ